MHKGQSHPGEHQAIVGQDLWDKVHAILGESPEQDAGADASPAEGSPVRACGLGHGSHSHPEGWRLYRYYVSSAVLKQGRDACPVGCVPAGEVEAAVIGQVRRLLTAPEVIVRTWRAARDQDAAIGEGEVRAALSEFDPVWEELFPAEQARIVQLLVERVDVAPEGIGIRLRTEGLASLVQDLRAGTQNREAA